MARICVFLSNLHGGGGERIGLFIATTLAAAGHEVEIAVSRNEGVLAEDGFVQAHRVDLNARSEFSVRPFLDYYRASRPDLVIAMGRTAKIVAGIASQFAPELPLVIAVHGVLERPRLSRFWLRAAFGHWPERCLYRRSLAAQTPTAAMSQSVERCFGLPPERIATILNPVTLERSASEMPPDHAGWFDRPVLVTAGRLGPQKNQGDMIRAFALSGLAPGTRLLILGQGSHERRLRLQAARLGVADSIIFGGFVPDVAPYFRRAAGFLLSSVHEAFGLVLLEALACRIPVASYDCPTGPAEVLDHGRLGRLVPPGDVEALAQAMRDMVSGVLKPPSDDALAAHLATFAPDRIARQWVEAVESWLALKAGQANAHPA